MAKMTQEKYAHTHHLLSIHKLSICYGFQVVNFLAQKSGIRFDATRTSGSAQGAIVLRTQYILIPLYTASVVQGGREIYLSLFLRFRVDNVYNSTRSTRFFFFARKVRRGGGQLPLLYTLKALNSAEVKPTKFHYGRDDSFATRLITCVRMRGMWGVHDMCA